MILIPPSCTCQPDEKSFGMLLVRNPECGAHGRKGALCNNQFGQPGCSGLGYRHRCTKSADHGGRCLCTCGATT